MNVTCTTCMHHCTLAPGQTGPCRARTNQDGVIVCSNYGKITALELDPIEKKPLRMFYPGSMILSLGSYGCNLHCPFCQNASISQADESSLVTKYMPPAEIVERAIAAKSEHSIGIAYTYNEPLVSWEYVRDTAKLARGFDLKNVIVTNGSVLPAVLDEVLPYTDAMNIDLKGFTEGWYKKLGGDLETVKAAIKECAAHTHVELTTLIVPGCNDSPDEMAQLASWVASVDKNIALHITRFFPRYKMKNVDATFVGTIYELAGVAQGSLKNVFTGNC